LDGKNRKKFAPKREKGTTTTRMYPLARDERINELARLLGGSEITERTLANAEDLLVAA